MPTLETKAAPAVSVSAMQPRAVPSLLAQLKVMLSDINHQSREADHEIN
jgi:hypothetical protein